MTVLKNKKTISVSDEALEMDEQIYRKITDTTLTPSQRKNITTPEQTYPEQDCVLAVHFHPEHIPLELVGKRINRMFPNSTSGLIIPTQHNILMSFEGYAGTEMDCYAPEFSRKVQLLLHFEASRTKAAHVLKQMLAHTFKYRSKQLTELISVILDPQREEAFQRAVRQTGADSRLVGFVKEVTHRFYRVYQKHESVTPPALVKNKLLRYYIDEMRNRFDNALITRAQLFLQTVKQVMKSSFSLKYFYSVHEVIEETRALGGGIVIPHPEQFWPILLAGYDVDGYEVWNPQSQEYTEFLIDVVGRENQTRRGTHRPLLVFMGDDTHMGEKLLDSDVQDPEKAGRQIGLQPAWDDAVIKKRLMAANTGRESVIREYADRLNGKK